MTLLYLVAAWTTGVFLVPDHSTTGTWLLIALGAAALAFWQRKIRSRRLFLLYVMMFALGAARYANAARPLSPNDIGSFADMGYVSFTGIITGEPDVRDHQVNLRVDARTLILDGISRTTKGVVLVQAPRFGTYSYGDRVRVRGFLNTPPEFDDFSYRDYLARRGIHALVPNAEVEHLAGNQGHPWLAALYKFKNRALITINNLLPSPEAPLLSGILLGVESSIPTGVREDFNITGTAHVIAISGSNIIVVIQVLLNLLTPAVGKNRARFITILGIASYAVLVGANAAVVRAAIMGSLTLMAAQSGRRAHGLTSLAFSVWLMTLWNPFTLWDISFQLSVAAVLGLVMFSHPFANLFERLLRRGFTAPTAQSITHHLSEPIIFSLAAQITTTPLILVYFQRLSLISLLANLLIVPVQPLIMVLGWLATAAGMIWQPVGELVAWIAWLPLTYTLRMVNSLANIEWAAIDMRLETSHAWLTYLALAGIALLLLQHPEDRAQWMQRLSQRAATLIVLTSAIIVAALVWLVALTQPDGKLHVWFLDVGHGHAVLIQTPQGAQILVDGGPNPTLLRQAIGDAMPFWDHDLDALIITQPDSSTTNALPALLDRYDVRLILTNGQTGDHGAYWALQRTWQTNHTQVILVSAGYTLQTGDGVSIQILHPQVPPTEKDDPKDATLVLRLQFGDTSFLITNDLTPNAQEALNAAGWYIGSTVLELASHGSAKANPPEFLTRTNPQVVVVGIGAGNRSGLPAPAVEEQVFGLTGRPLYRTDHHGTVEITTDGSSLWLGTTN